MLSVAYDPNLGGSDFDRLIAEHFADEFVTRYHINARENRRAYVRLLLESERLKKLMSANTQEIPLNIECFINEKDVTGKMCREQFEKLSTSLLDRAEMTMRQILQVSSKNLFCLVNLNFLFSFFSLWVHYLLYVKSCIWTPECGLFLGN